MKTNTSKQLIAVVGSVALLAACGGGGGGSSLPSTSNLPTDVKSTLLTIPVAGEIVADCADTGTGQINSIVDTVDALTPSGLPADLPTLSDVLGAVPSAPPPVIAGLVPDTSGLSPIDVSSVAALLPGGLPTDLPVIDQLSAVCSDLVSALPSGVTTDPSALFDALGDPTQVIGVLPVFDAANEVVGVVIATVPSGLLPGGTPPLPGLPTVPDLSSLAPIDPATLPVVGPTVGSTTGMVLGLLDSNGSLAGLTGLLSLVP